MIEILLIMLERLGIIVTVAFLMTRIQYFRSILDQQEVKLSHQFIVTVLFGFFGIIGTYTGLPVNFESLEVSTWLTTLNENEAIANSRIIGVVAGGLLGGWRVGLGAGLIAGGHRLMLGGFTSVSCSLATIIAGLLAGILQNKIRYGRKLWIERVLFIGMFAEVLEMSLILLISRPFERSLVLVENIGLPMIIANGIGGALFLLIIQNVISEEEKMGVKQAQKALRLAELTIGHLRNGLTVETAKATCRILLNEVQATAVSITDCERILAHTGLASDHHKEGDLIHTQATRRAIETGKLIITKPNEIDCNHKGCPLSVAVIAPLKRKNETIGALKIYFQNQKEISDVKIEFVRGLSSLLSQQIEISDAEKYYQLMKDAEIKTLQAQVSPHFLFNALNTIVSLIRLDPDKARKLLISLSRFIRQNLSSSSEAITTLEQEINHVKAYLTIEETRFIDKLQVKFEIDEETLNTKIPTMTLQPIVENAIRHGIKGMVYGSEIKIVIKKVNSEVEIKIIDNGVGMTGERINQLLKSKVSSEVGTGMGLHIVNRRLEIICGQRSQLQIVSILGKGTTITFYLPFLEKGDITNDR